MERRWSAFRPCLKSDHGTVDASSGSRAPGPQALAPRAAAATPALDVVTASSADDERRRGSPGGRHRRFQEPRSEFERRFGPAGAQVGDGAHSRLNRPAAAKSCSYALPPFSVPHATDPGESRFSKRRNKRLWNSSSVHSRKVQDVFVLDDEDEEPKEQLSHEMSDRLNEQMIYYPSRDDREAVVLTRSDMKCLDPGAFLSSSVINFYIKYIQRTRLCNGTFRDKFYIFNTFFYGKLEKALYQTCDFPKLRRWWNSFNIFNNAYILLPIHAKQHWSLVIICLPPKEGISEPIILHLDSLGMHRSAKILDTVGRYLEKEWLFLSVAEPEWPCLLRDIRKETVQVPQQNNGYDCGIFMLYYIEQFIKEAPARMTTDKLDMFSHSWFRPEEASGLRHRIRELLLEEFESARLDDPISKANASHGYDSITDGQLQAHGSSKMVVEVDVGFGNNEEKGKSIVIASPERLKGNEEAVGSTPIPDNVVHDSGIKRSEGNEEFNGTMPVPDAVCEITRTKADASKGYDSIKDRELEAEDNSKMVIEVGVGFGNTEKEGKPIAIASPERLKGNEEAMGSTPMPDDVVRDSGVKRSEGNEEFNGSMPIPDVVCEITGTKADASKGYDNIKDRELEADDNSKMVIEVGVGFGNTEKKGKPIVIASPERLKGNEEAMGSTPIPDVVVCDSSVKRSEGNEEFNSSMPIPDAVCEITGTKADASKGYDSIKDRELEADDNSKMVIDAGVGFRNTEKEGKPNVIASEERLKGNDEAMGSTPIRDDIVRDSRVKRSEGNEEFNGSMPIPDAVCEITGTKADASKGYDSIKDRELEADDNSKMVIDAGVGFRNTEKEGKPNVIASAERLKGNDEAMGSTPVRDDIVRDSRVKRSEGNDEFNGSMPIPDAVCEITGTKLWIKRIYRPPITLPLDNWYRSRGRSSRDDDDRRAFIEQFCRK